VTSIGLASGWDFASKKQQPPVSGCAVSRYVGGRYRIRTCDFHRVNLTVLGFTTTYKYVKTAEVPVRHTRRVDLWNGLWNEKYLVLRASTVGHDTVASSPEPLSGIDRRQPIHAKP
jgi:hypothetical protein